MILNRILNQLETRQTLKLLLIAGLSVLVVSCSMMRGNSPSKGGYYQSDGPPARSDNKILVEDAQPRWEPHSRTGNKPYKALGNQYYPLSSASGFTQRGRASWYGKQFHGRRTSSGETYDMFKMTAAHPTLPLPTYVRVQNLDNGRVAVVRVNDRGPFKSSRIIDLSYAAASKLGLVQSGTANVAIVAITPAKTANNTATNNNASNIVVNSDTTSRVENTLQGVSGVSTISGHYVQAGAFSTVENARQFELQLIQNGFSPVQIQSPGQSLSQFYKVRIGPIESAQQADIFRIKLAQELNVKGLVVLE